MNTVDFDINLMPAVEAGKYKIRTVKGVEGQLAWWSKDGKLTVDFPGHRVEYHNARGKWWDDGTSDSDLDLVLERVYDYDRTLDDKVSSIIVEAVRTYCEKNNLDEPHYVGLMLGDELALKYHNAILALAKEEVMNSDETLKEYAETARKQGATEALKPIPKWKIAENNYQGSDIQFAVFHRVDGGDGPDWDDVVVTNRLRKGEWYFNIYDLHRLPKEGNK